MSEFAKSISRRAALKLTGSGALAGLVTKPKPTGSPGFVRSRHYAEPVEGQNADTPWNLWNRIWRARTWEQVRHSEAIDPDIRALRSVSPVMRAWLQRKRNDEMEDWSLALRKKLGV